MPPIREDWFEADRLVRAAADGDLPEVVRLHEHGFDVNLLDELSKGALHYAAENGHYKVVEWLLTHGAAVNLHDAAMIGETPLNLAVRQDYPEMVELLLKHGADPDIAGWMSLTARFRAHDRKDEDGIKIASIIEHYKPSRPNPGARSKR